MVESSTGEKNIDDTNYIFLSFVKSYLPVGLIGLVIGVIFSASMGSTSGEINALATVSVIDIYRRYLVRAIAQTGIIYLPHASSQSSGAHMPWPSRPSDRTRLRSPYRASEHRGLSVLWRPLGCIRLGVLF